MTARSPGWRIGRVGSAPLYLAPSWLVVAAILTVVFLPTVRAWAPELSGIAAVGAALCFPLGLFVSVLAHELAHGAMATALKVQVREYVVTFWGGHTSFSAGTLTPGSSAAISFAGPLANLVLGGLGWILLQPMSAGLPAVIVASLTWSNLVVAAFTCFPDRRWMAGRSSKQRSGSSPQIGTRVRLVRAGLVEAWPSRSSWSAH